MMFLLVSCQKRSTNGNTVLIISAIIILIKETSHLLKVLEFCFYFFHKNFSVKYPLFCISNQIISVHIYFVDANTVSIRL